jgi:hypothetical protein
MFISIILNLVNNWQSRCNLLFNSRDRTAVVETIELQPQGSYNLDWWFESRLDASKHNL